MNSLNLKKILITAILIIPLAVAIYVIWNYSKTGNRTFNSIYEKQVEGESTLKIPETIIKDIPLLPGSEITSFDTSNETISFSVETNSKEQDIKKFYEEYFKKNAWKKTKPNTYQKDNKNIHYQIAGNIVKIVIFK
jgi:heme/copper-type cytochrome/quinol oxidase subunit 2